MMTCTIVKEIVIENKTYKKDIDENKDIHNTFVSNKINFDEEIAIETKKKKKRNHLKECFIDSDDD